MTAPILYPNENADGARRQSSIDQFRGFLSVWKQGGWAPVVFDQLDGITCETVKTHPIVIDLTEDSLGYVYPEGKCVYFSDKYIYFDKEGVEQKLLPACFGGEGEWYDSYIKSSSFVVFDDASAGVHNEKRLRVGLDYVKCKETLPFVD